MPKILGSREKRHQPFWDTAVRGSVGNWTFASGAAAMQQTLRLFTAGGGGNLGISNMEGGGQFLSDQTYRILAMRVGLYFLRSAGTVAGLALNDWIMYHHAKTQIQWELRIQEKTAFASTTEYLPTGGGLFGDMGTSTDVYFNNGVPSQEATLKLARSIALPARQGFLVLCTTNVMGALNFVNELNGITTGEAWITFYVDGLHVRDIL
jgi:hypothetical protein